MLTPNELTIIINSGIILICVLIATIFGVSIFRYIKRSNYVKGFSDYRAVLEYNMEKAYDMIHKEHILTYSLDAFRIDEKDYDRISKEFVRLVGKLNGPVLLKEFVYLYGNENNYSFNLLEYFSNRYENDEIRNSALEQITESDVDDNLKL
jgi:hypothetical protein